MQNISSWLETETRRRGEAFDGRKWRSIIAPLAACPQQIVDRDSWVFVCGKQSLCCQMLPHCEFICSYLPISEFIRRIALDSRCQSIIKYCEDWHKLGITGFPFEAADVKAMRTQMAAEIRQKKLFGLAPIAGETETESEDERDDDAASYGGGSGSEACDSRSDKKHEAVLNPVPTKRSLHAVMTAAAPETAGAFAPALQQDAKHENAIKAEVERRLQAKVNEKLNEWMVHLRATNRSMDIIPGRRKAVKKKELEGELRPQVESDVRREVQSEGTLNFASAHHSISGESFFQGVASRRTTPTTADDAGACERDANARVAATAAASARAAAAKRQRDEAARRTTDPKSK